MPTSLPDILRRLGPSRSSVVAKILTDEGLSPVAARKVVSRGHPDVSRLRGLHLPNREAFLFLHSQYPTAAFKESLASALSETGTSYGRALESIRVRGGEVSIRYFQAISG